LNSLEWIGTEQVAVVLTKMNRRRKRENSLIRIGVIYQARVRSEKE
jgi:hypothetical protein